MRGKALQTRKKPILRDFKGKKARVKDRLNTEKRESALLPHFRDYFLRPSFPISSLYLLMSLDLR